MILIKRMIKRVSIYLGVRIHEVQRHIERATLPQFANNPKKIVINTPRKIVNPRNISIGENVFLGPNTFLNAIVQYPTTWMEKSGRKEDIQYFNPKITIGSNVTATSGLQVVAQDTITIENDVMFASNIHINDALHGYAHADEAYKYQPLWRIAPILIKRGCWIGQNVVILPGVTIGKLSIIGANSIVTKSIPSRCIAVGNPVKVIKKWDKTARKWINS
jgi:acetyltransferase-like isoleucine patch superfamily enzyme